MAIPVKTTLRTARAEAAAVVRAMGDGKHFLLLLRVGPADRETEARLLIQHLEFFLLPDRSTPVREQIRPEFQSYVDGASDHEGGKVTIRYRAMVTEGVMILEGSQLRGLTDFHIWDEDQLRRQVRWDPKDPPFLVTCKVERIDPPMVLPWKSAYETGEWVTLDGDFPAATFEPVVPHVDYLKVALDVKKVLAEAQKNPIEPPAAPANPAEAQPAAAAQPSQPAAQTGEERPAASKPPSS